MIKKKWSVRIAAFALVTVCLVGAAIATAGDRNDPLVTLSYLNDTVTPAIVTQVEELTARRQEELELAFAQAVKEGGGSVSSGTGASFEVVTLSSGQKLTLSVGCEVMLRVGTAKVTADSAPALINMTTGADTASGSALTVNNLYLATIDGRTVEATAATVKLLVRGDYAVG